MAKQLTLILGGARSGKSDYAQRLAELSGQPVLFVATAAAGDEEMAQRIAAHRASRPAGWTTLEAPLQVGAAIRAAGPAPLVLLDCITLLASNVLFSCPEPLEETLYHSRMSAEMDALVAAYEHQAGEWLVVSNEVGLGLVPPAPLSRYYRDALGRANQRLARLAERVVLMVAGIPLEVK